MIDGTLAEGLIVCSGNNRANASFSVACFAGVAFEDFVQRKMAAGAEIRTLFRYVWMWQREREMLWCQMWDLAG
jgi:hypothetical protein